MMNSCYICSTPFQILTSMSIADKSEGLSDIYIINKFKDAPMTGKRLEKTGFFNKVSIIEDVSANAFEGIKKRSIQAYTLHIKNYLEIDKLVNSMIPNIINYSDLYISCNSFMPRLFALYIKKKKLNVQIHYYDDGIGSYYDKKMYDISNRDYWGRLIFIGKRATKIEYDLYLYNPDLFREMLPQYNVALNKIKMLKKTEQNEVIVKHLYEISDDYTISQKVIYFDVVRKDFVNISSSDYVDSLIKKIENLTGEENMVVKPHPRDTKKRVNCQYYSGVSQPLESLCFFQNFNDKVLISSFSTALFTPKLLYDQEPTIIFIYKILGEEEPLRDALCESIKSIYFNPNKVHIPETEEDLRLIIDAEMKDR